MRDTKKIVLFQNEFAENDFLTSHYQRIDSGYPIHWHNYIEIELVLSGTAEHIFNGIISPVERGHISVLRINDYHALQNANALEVLNLSISEHTLPEPIITALNTTPNNLSYDLSEQDFQTLRNFAECCIAENERSDRNEQYIKNLLECILIFVLRLDSPRQQEIFKTSNQPLNAALTYLHNHFREDPGLEKVARIAHYSTSHFSRAFHKEIGRTYNEYLNELKITYAKQLLTTTELKVIDVGLQCGFSSYNNFFATFKKHTGISPGEYQKARRSDRAALGYSWRFSLCGSNFYDNPAYVYIKATDLEVDAVYEFSYDYSYDYVIQYEGLQTASGERLTLLTPPRDVALKDKKRTHRVTVRFQTKVEEDHIILLKMGKGLNNTDCKYRFTVLSHLVLKRCDNTGIEENLAKNYTHANGSVMWSDNSSVYAVHIDR